MSGKCEKLFVQAILFDLDGVLVDSTACVERHWRNWSHKHNLDYNEVIKFAHGRRTIETMSLVAPFLDLEQEAAVYEDLECSDFQDVNPLPGSYALLKALPSKKWAVVTSGGNTLAPSRL